MAELTQTERRVALLAAAGRRNAEVAVELGLAVKTVESHLTRVYRKLGIRSRAELGETLGPNGPLRNVTFTHTNEEEPELKQGKGSR